MLFIYRYKWLRKLLRPLLTDKTFIHLEFRRRLGKAINLKNPKSFSEKIQWIKLHDRNPLMTLCTDKYEVRKVVESKVGTHILNKLYGVFESADEIDWDSLPESFVLKANHGSGWNVIVKDKSTLDGKETKKKMKKWMATNYYAQKREWAYKNIKPQIVCEKYLENKNGSLIDYKFFCFNGTPRLIQVDVDRHTEHKRVFHDTQWRRFDFSLQYPIYEEEIEPPSYLKDMIEVARVLSSDFTFARVDMYDLDGNIVFGEVTFYPGSGMERFSPEHWDAKLGDLLQLPTYNKQ